MGRNRIDQKAVSWAYFLLPQIEETAIYSAYDKNSPVNALANSATMRTPVETYACPTRRKAEANRNFDNNDAPPAPGDMGVASLGDFAANAGLQYDTGMLGGDNGAAVFGQYNRRDAGPIFSGSRVGARQVSDGLSKTLAIGERHIPPEESVSDQNQVHFEQGDTCFLAADNVMAIFRGAEDGLAEGPHDDSEEVFGGPHPGVTLFVFLDGHTEALSNTSSARGIGVNPLEVEDINIDDEWLWLGALCTVAGADSVVE
jgi:hypothetical protein